MDIVLERQKYQFYIGGRKGLLLLPVLLAWAMTVSGQSWYIFPLSIFMKSLLTRVFFTRQASTHTPNMVLNINLLYDTARNILLKLNTDYNVSYRNPCQDEPRKKLEAKKQNLTVRLLHIFRIQDIKFIEKT